MCFRLRHTGSLADHAGHLGLQIPFPIGHIVGRLVSFHFMKQKHGVWIHGPLCAGLKQNGRGGLKNSYSDSRDIVLDDRVVHGDHQSDITTTGTQNERLVLTGN